MERVIAVLATLAVGGLIALQPPVNAQLAKGTSVLAAAFVSTATSAAIMGLLFIVAGRPADLAGVTSVRPVYLLGGVLGAVLVSVTLVTVKTLGAGGVAAATISSQLVVSALLDRAGVLGLERIGLTPLRVTGFVLLLAGTALVTASR